MVRKLWGLLLTLLVSSSVLISAQERVMTLRGNHLDEPFMQRLVDLFDVKVFVETGTYRGDTAHLGTKYFKEVHTIELSHKHYVKAKARFRGNKAVHCYEGSSEKALATILSKSNGRVLFWLDAHYSGGDTAKGASNSPLCEEIRAIKNSGVKDGVILIDDIRACQGAPEDVAYYGGWPSIPELRQMILEISSDYEFWVLGDLAIAYSKKDNVRASPLVKACTMSRLCLATDLSDLEVLEQEASLIALAKEEEAAVIDELFREFIDPSMNTDNQTYHYILWKGLVSLGREEFDFAAECFQRAMSAGYTHPRLKDYLARSVQKNIESKNSTKP